MLEYKTPESNKSADRLTPALGGVWGTAAHPPTRCFMYSSFYTFVGLYSLNYPRFVSQTHQLCKTETLICETVF
jgi:hypothetical protein